MLCGHRATCSADGGAAHAASSRGSDTFPGSKSRRLLLLLVAPGLHVHLPVDTLLRYMAPEIKCELVGIEKKRREGSQVVFRKRRTEKPATDLHG